MDLWGRCTTCDRWFSMAGGTRACPVCQLEPVTVTDRDAAIDPAVNGAA